jgi:hypothetical protein
MLLLLLADDASTNGAQRAWLNYSHIHCLQLFWEYTVETRHRMHNKKTSCASPKLASFSAASVLVELLLP